jgi:hypothetical protein
MTYQPAVYRKLGGNEFVVASSGDITVESGGQVTVQSGGSLTIESGGSLNVDSGGILFSDPQTLTSATVSTTITPAGATFLTGSTTGPVYLLPTPVAGYSKDLTLIATSSGATHRAVIYCNSTGRTIGNITGDAANQMTLATSACTGARLVASSSLAWRVVSTYGTPTFSNKTT